MSDKKEYMEQIYEQFAEEMIPTEEMKKIYEKFSKKIEKLKSELSEKLENDLDELEDLFSEMASLEVKQAFCKGFSVASNLNSEVKNN